MTKLKMLYLLFSLNRIHDETFFNLKYRIDSKKIVILKYKELSKIVPNVIKNEKHNSYRIQLFHFQFIFSFVI